MTSDQNEMKQLDLVITVGRTAGICIKIKLHNVFTDYLSWQVRRDIITGDGAIRVSYLAL